MKSLKENVSRDINYIISNQSYEGDTSTCRLRARANIQKFQIQFLQKYGTHQSHFPNFRWQKSFHDHIIRNPKDLTRHINYTIWNHLKHKLPENWKYTSLNFPDMLGPNG